MHPKASVAVLFGTLLAASAQSTAPNATSASPTGPLVTLLIPGADPQPLVGSIVNVASSLTTLAVKCAPGTDSNDCGLPDDALTITRGPSTEIVSTVIAEESDPVVVTQGWYCSLGGTTTAECVYKNEATVTATANASLLSEILGGATSTATTIQLNGTDLKSAFMPVTITAGAEKLSQTGNATGSSTPTQTPGAAASVKIGGLTVLGAVAGILML